MLGVGFLAVVVYISLIKTDFAERAVIQAIIVFLFFVHDVTL